MINAIPVIGWLVSLIIALGLSVPFWLFWTVCGLGQTYFRFLPSQFQSIPFWHCVGLFVVASILRTQVPSIITVSQSATPAEKK